MARPGWHPFPAGILLTPADGDDILDKYGDQTTIRRAVQCDCVDADTLRAAAACDRCHGWGVLHPAELELIAKVQWAGYDASRELRDGGTREGADYTATVPSTITLGHGDVLVHPVEEAITHDLLRRGTIGPDGLITDRLRFRLVVGVEAVVHDGAVLEEGVAWALAPDGRSVTWLADPSAPAAGEHYTVRYRYRAEYVVGGKLPKIRTDGGQRLTSAVHLMRFDPLVPQQGRDFAEPEA